MSTDVTPGRGRSLLALAGWIALSLAAGAVGGFASLRAAEFYRTLDTPPWAPPSWLFGPVWTVLYVMMGVAAWMVWRERERRPVRGALALFVVQLALNALWTWLFFAWRVGAAALTEIVVLSLVVVATIAAFARVRRTAAWLLVPYLGWLAYATALTAAIWRRNPIPL